MFILSVLTMQALPAYAEVDVPTLLFILMRATQVSKAGVCSLNSCYGA